ncbi:rho guanine nucleotide exchange factor 15 isoform X2 [Electrophorus electricus]|uniref:rho guanine nucleotide exchange factor 15 isoform X2 n=1 Tax=Electrophorus electricus TaxID=8005 RepID=UPI0015D0AF5D|nr:rho guanine nucleotide exchange factor 15 isoform X2 [Electrophorus electricus]
MSAPQTVESPPKPEVKRKPPLPLKSTNGTSDTPPTIRTTPARISGNVQKIVSKFNQPNAESFSEAIGSRGSRRRTKRPPTVKPRSRFPPKIRVDQAPPLPEKQSKKLQQEAEQEGRNKPAAVGEGRGDGVILLVTAHDARGVALWSAGTRPEQKPSHPAEPQCQRACSCICHLHRPGMKLVWVPIPDDEKVGEEKEVRQGCLAEPRPEEHPKECAGEDESETSDTEEDEDEDEETTSGSSEEEEKCEDKAPLTNKEKFQVTLDLIEGQLRRTSDPGPEVALTSVKPLPQTSPIKANSFPEEESIYEASLDLLTVPRDASLQVLVIPPCQITTEGEAECSPPDIPPRMPLDKAKTPRFPRSTPLAQMQVPSVSKLPPAVDSPPRSPKPLRPAPAPPILAKANSRHLISQSSTCKDEVEGSSAGDVEKQEKKRPATLTRQKSLDMEAHMPEELLYQVYTESYITKEIRRQTVCRNISKTSMDFQIEFPRIAASSGTGAGGSRSSPVPSLQSTLWQDLPAVRESGILQTLTPEECKYQESMFEVLTSEVSYLRSLRVLTDHFLDSWELNETLINLDKKTLFSNILRIREVSEKFLKDLEERLDERLLVTDICDIINYHAQHNFPAYIDYVRNQNYQEKTYSSLMQSNEQFATVIARLQEAPKCQRLPFVSFLLLPFQRITRIKMLIENILKRTAVGTKEEESASKALASVSKIIAVCNTEVGKMKQVEELIQINKMLEFDKLKAVPIISQNRFLEKRGELQELAKGATLFNLKPRFSPVFLFLFNDLLIIANKKGAERYVVMDHAHRSLVQVQEHSEDSPSPSLENCFNLTLLENHQGRMMERLLKAPSQSDMHRWLAAFPNPDDPHGDQDEVIYEDWDCPQVQCVEQYVANQTDELNLDPPEIINVIRKANEGWYQGIRMSDGQKGWFPVANVAEITNEHVRRRNLRERYRVIQAASSVTHKLSNLS